MLYTGEKTKEITFPLGGIGTGSIGLSGNGCLVDWEIFNRPNKGSLNGYSFFAIKAEYPNGKNITKILQGDWQRDYSGRYGYNYGTGPSHETMCGFPHFKNVKFNGTFPIATLTFQDDDFPAKVTMKAFNPLIPLDADNSSIPAAFFDINIASQADGITYSLLLSVKNPFEIGTNKKIQHDRYTAIKLSYYGKSVSEKDYGDMTIAVDRQNGIYQEYWYRGAWQYDMATTFWHDLTHTSFENRHYEKPQKGDICSVGVREAIDNNQSQNFRFLISWNIPNNYNYWEPYKDADGNDITWKNYYATKFEDSFASCCYALDNWKMLYRKTNRFCRSIHSSTVDKAVIDAVSSTLSVLKTPTVLRLEDGTLYGWEGIWEKEGSCEGTCTHVWSYAYALCFLFPELERSLRNTEIQYDTDEYGCMQFRTKLPLGRQRGNFRACVDGQMATIIKIYRDWKLTGNDLWLRDNWADIKKILEFAWSEHNPDEWDRNTDGVLEGRQHHTLDTELFGPSSWLQGMYLAALKAAAELADYLDDSAKADEYHQLFEKGYQWTKENLFNGNYFFHAVDLENKAITEHFDCPVYWNAEQGQLQYQIGEGCAIDQMLGQWHASICGLGNIFDEQQRHIALKSMMNNNFKSPISDIANTWRIYALNDERGAVICSYPDGSKKPVISVPYFNECMTGFEYAFAGLLISDSFVTEGLEVVRAIRERYDGKKRNPWNEIECGNNYARPMASFALLPILSGFSFDLPHKQIGFSPVVSGNFKCFWSLGTGWGDFIKTDSQCKITLASGFLDLDSVILGGVSTVNAVFVDGKEIPFSLESNRILLNGITVKKDLRFEVSN